MSPLSLPPVKTGGFFIAAVSGNLHTDGLNVIPAVLCPFFHAINSR